MKKVSFNFSDENYVVTGASSGIGRQVTIELADAGATVLGIGRNIERLEEVKSHFPEKIITMALDVCDFKALQSAIDEFVKNFGKLSGGVHCAGINGFTPLRLYDMNLAEQIMRVNVFAGVELLRLITKKKYAKNSTSTVMLSSVVGTHSSLKGLLAYAASKAAVDSAVRNCAKEINDAGHRVNSIVAGHMDSPMSRDVSDFTNTEELKRRHLLGIGKVSDVVGMILFLLSDRADWITGSNIVVDGGYLA